MDRSKRLHRLRDEGRRIAALLTDEVLDVPVPTCPGWDVGKLARHLGRVYGWAGAATRCTQAPARPEIAWPTDAAGLRDALLTRLALLLDDLEGEAHRPAWSFAPGHGSLGFWQRRLLIETAVHRWDADQALGRDAAIDPEIAVDGLDELAEVLIGLRLDAGDLPHGTAVAAETAEGGTWTWGHGRVVARVRGTASDLLLLAWGRLAPDAATLAWSGDVAAGHRLVSSGLTP